MPVTKKYPVDVDKKLFETFSRFGYDGTSVELLAKASGLKKASLYHRFPGGKKEMASHVLRNMADWITENVSSVLNNNALSTDVRLKKALTALNKLYSGENSNCILRMLSVGSDSEAFRPQIAACFNMLIDGFTNIAIENGLPKGKARAKAKEAVIELQGSLVLSRALNDKTLVKNWLSGIPSLLSY
jgi:TetR/AcrR family transcriptional repressor of lmrAB and yxaGH operons